MPTISLKVRVEKVIQRHIKQGLSNLKKQTKNYWESSLLLVVSVADKIRHKIPKSDQGMAREWQCNGV